MMRTKSPDESTQNTSDDRNRREKIFRGGLADRADVIAVRNSGARARWLVVRGNDPGARSLVDRVANAGIWKRCESVRDRIRVPCGIRIRSDQSRDWVQRHLRSLPFS